MTNQINRARGPIVWVIEKMPHDYTPARVYAEDIRQIVADKLVPNAPDDSWNADAVRQLRRAFADYIPGLDYIIPTGSPVRMLTTGLLLKELGDVHNFLGYDARTNRYLLYRIDLRRVPSRTFDKV